MPMSPAAYMPADYWINRAHMNYYAAVRELVEEYSPGDAILDVGGYDTPVATWGKFRRRYTVDAVLDPQFPGVLSAVADFLVWNAPERMSVVVCCQVLEHLSDGDVERFAKRLLAAGDVVIVTVPYCWPAGGEPSHIQDPIDVPKLARIMGRRPDRARLVADGKRRRLVGVWTT